MKMRTKRIFLIIVIIAAFMLAQASACFAARDEGFISVTNDRTDGRYAFKVKRVANAATGQLIIDTDITFDYKIQFETDTYEIIKEMNGSSGIPAGQNDAVIDVTAEVNAMKEEILKHNTVTIICTLKNVKGARPGTDSQIIINNPKNLSEEQLKALMQMFEEMSQNIEGKAGGNNDQEVEPGQLPAAPGSERTGTIEMTIGNPLMRVNGVLKEIDPGQGTTPVLVQGRTFLPIKAVVGEIGGTVSWDGAEQKVSIQWQGKHLELWIGQTVMQVNGVPQNLDVAPYISPTGRTMLPLRFVGESLGCDFDWDGATQTITITY